MHDNGTQCTVYWKLSLIITNSGRGIKSVTSNLDRGPSRMNIKEREITISKWVIAIFSDAGQFKWKRPLSLIIFATILL